MNAVEKEDTTTDCSSVKMSKRRSKNRKQQSRPEQNSTTVPEQNVSEKTAINGDSIDLINQKLEGSLHIKENGCMQNHITIDHDPTKITPNTSKNVLHASKTHSSKQMNKVREPQGDNKVLENGDARLTTSKSKKSKQSTISSATHSIGKLNGNNNVKTPEKQLPSAVDCPSESLSKTLLDDTTQTTDTISQESEGKIEKNSPVKGNVMQTEGASTENRNSHISDSDRLSNSNNVDEVERLSKEIAISEPTTTVINGLDLSNAVIEYKEYESELQMQDIMRLIQTELSEPYSIYTYRYFIYNWPKLCFLAAHGNEYVGAIVCKLDMHMNVKRGYIAMLAVKKEYRKLKIGTTLVQKAIEAMLADDADEVVLETEMKNIPALRLYENLGFVRDKRLFRYYLNGVDALRLKLWFR